MAKKITNEDFKRIVTAAGLDFDIYGYDGFLNTYAIYAEAYAEYAERKGYDILAKCAMQERDVIIRELSRAGVYDWTEEERERQHQILAEWERNRKNQNFLDKNPENIGAGEEVRQ